MKVLTKSLLTFLLASGVFLLAEGVAAQEADPADPAEADPCLKTVTNEEKLCLDKNEACTANPGGCCGNYACVGFAFFKKCVDPPACHEIWHDCSDGIDCCDGMKCIAGTNGKLECGIPTIGSRTVTIGEFDLVENPTPSPPPPTNLKTTKKVPVEMSIASSSGDPHIKTFDGLKYDCQGHGEHILAKSLVTRREIQARYEHLAANKPISVARGVAVQDEGDTPLVQVSVATNDDTIGNDMGDGCKLLFFVDREQKDLEEPYDDGKVKVTKTGTKIKVFYHESEMSVEIGYFKCRMNINAQIPVSDITVGVLGTNNNDVKDDWTLLDGTILEIPNTGDKLRKPGYDFCTQFCNRDPKASLFTYVEQGVDFDTYERCDLPYGSTLDKYLNDVPQWVIDICGPNNFACIMDVLNGDATDAMELRKAETLYASICSPPGGSCDERKCCGKSKCVSFGGLAGSVCDGDVSLGVPEFGSCKTNPKCQEGLSCVPLDNGDAQCRLELPCQKDWMSCNENADCCDNSICMENANTGVKQCRKLPSCMKQWDDCSIVGCCGNLKCVQEGGMKMCKEIPDCWNKQDKDCSTTPCCDGLTCVRDLEGRNLCKKLPTCVRKNQNCLWSPCCDDPANPLQCAEVTDTKGRTSKQCLLSPGGAEVSVFNDSNGNGIQDEGEPGIPGVELQLVDSKNTPFAKGSEGNIHEVLTTDVSGRVSFTSVPKEKPVKVRLVKAPKGAVPTQSRRGTDRSKDSDLNGDGYTNSFTIKGSDVFKGIDLGLLMPVDIEIEVFNDLNSNGIREAGEEGIKGVKIRLETSNKQNPTFHPVADLQTGGNAHQELVSDASGKVVFTKVPQNIKVRAKVLAAPKGAIPTTRNADKNKQEDFDSDLKDDGTTDEISTHGDEDDYITKVDIGYRMPESVIVRVWEDTNRNGKQDQGEIGIKDVKLQLVTDNNKQPFGDAAVTDADGLATFTNVPQNLKLRVQVIGKPAGAIKTIAKQGGDVTVDSDLEKDDLSYPFTMTSSGAPFSSLDLGYLMPGSMKVFVWDDENANGVQDDGEAGLKGVKLCLVDKNSKNRLEKSDGNSHLEMETDQDGYVTFTGVPQGKELRVQVVDQPSGAIPTSSNQGDNKEADSDLRTDGYSDDFRVEAGEYTEIDLGYKMPDDVEVRVWDDSNGNGVQDEGEVGISGVTLRLVLAKGKQDLENMGTGGNCYNEMTTDDDGYAKFTKVPKGVDLQVKITNAPAGAVKTVNNSKNGDDTSDSDFGSDDFSSSFNLSNFVGSTFSSIDLGFKMPTSIEVRVWDDVNLNGIQDADEAGIEGVQLQLINDKGRVPLEDYEVLITDERGFVSFPDVPKDLKVRVKVLNPPEGAVATKRVSGNEEIDSDLDAGIMMTEAFNLASFKGIVFGNIDIGFQMPDDVEIKVWDDLNGNGIQDEGEPGIAGVDIQLINDKGKVPLENIGGGSTAHQTITTGMDGIAKFIKVPKATKIRAKVLNAPPGSISTTKANIAKTDATAETDSDLNTDMTSDVFCLTSFTGAGVYGELDLGFRMPKTMVIRAWNDSNRNGIQDDGEEDIAGVKMKIVNKNGSDLDQQGPNSTAHLELETDETGRVIYREVPQGIDLKIVVTSKPDNIKGATSKRKGSDRQLDSDLNTNMVTDVFKLPSDVNEKFDLIDLGFVLN